MARIRFSALPASRRAWLSHLFALGLGLVLTLSGQFAHAAFEEPDAFIKRLTSELMDIVKADKSILWFHLITNSP